VNGSLQLLKSGVKIGQFIWLLWRLSMLQMVEIQKEIETQFLLFYKRHFLFHLIRDIGHDYIEDVEELGMNFIIRRISKYPFDVDYLNRITGGGLSPKTLNLFVATNWGW
jgi:hypothetical protein